MIARLFALLYGIASYLVFLAVFSYAIAWVGNLWVPRGIDSPPVGPAHLSLAVDLALLGLFAVQHSVMARPGFKRRWTRLVPAPVERSTYVLAASAALALLVWQWRPLGGVVWNVEAEWARTALLVTFALGWLVLFTASFFIDHFELFGLRQVWDPWRGRETKAPRFATPGFYRYVRHPIYLGLLLGFWSAPTMTVTHLVFALATTAYILVGIQLEERDLVRQFGDRYRWYRQQVPMLIPMPGRSAARPPAADLPAAEPPAARAAPAGSKAAGA